MVARRRARERNMIALIELTLTFKYGVFQQTHIQSHILLPPPPLILSPPPMEQTLVAEAKKLIGKIKEERAKQTNGRKQDLDDGVSILQSDGTKAPDLSANPKRRRLLKGHFGKVRKHNACNPASDALQRHQLSSATPSMQHPQVIQKRWKKKGKKIQRFQILTPLL